MTSTTPEPPTASGCGTIFLLFAGTILAPISLYAAYRLFTQDWPKLTSGPATPNFGGFLELVLVIGATAGLLGVAYLMASTLNKRHK